VPAKAAEAVSAARARSELNTAVIWSPLRQRPQLPGPQAALLGQLVGQPAGGTTLLVVHGPGVGLEDQLNRHQPTLRTACRDTLSLVRDQQAKSAQDRRVHTR